jgi:hypothetical protein
MESSTLPNRRFTFHKETGEFLGQHIELIGIKDLARINGYRREEKWAWILEGRSRKVFWNVLRVLDSAKIYLEPR